MSLRPRPWPEPAEEITRAVLAMYGGRRAPLPIAVRDELGELFADAEFAAAFADRGPEGWSPGRLMLVTVLQAAENLTDRQAAEAVRDKISWKYALGLGLAIKSAKIERPNQRVFAGSMAEPGISARQVTLDFRSLNRSCFGGCPGQ